MTNLIPSPQVSLVNGQPATTSLAIAEHFGKPHDRVLKDIRRIIAETPGDFNAVNFDAVDYVDAKGENRPMFTVFFDGFILLAMGYTGKQALQIKLVYIAAFNAMREQLANPLPIPATIECYFSWGTILAYLNEYPPVKGLEVAVAKQSPFYTRNMGVRGRIAIFISRFQEYLSANGLDLDRNRITEDLRELGATFDLPKSVRSPGEAVSYGVCILPDWPALSSSVHLSKQSGQYLLPEKTSSSEEVCNQEVFAEIKQDLILLEAAIGGADIGQPELEDALRMRVLRIIQQIEDVA